MERGHPDRRTDDQRLPEKGVEARCGVRCPKAIGLQTREIWGVVTHEEDGRVVGYTGVRRD